MRPWFNFFLSGSTVSLDDFEHSCIHSQTFKFIILVVKLEGERATSIVNWLFLRVWKKCFKKKTVNLWISNLVFHFTKNYYLMDIFEIVSMITELTGFSMLQVFLKRICFRLFQKSSFEQYLKVAVSAIRNNLNKKVKSVLASFFLHTPPKKFFVHKLCMH